MTPLFYAECTYSYTSNWTKGKLYPVYKAELVSEQAEVSDGYGGKALQSQVSYYFLTVDDSGNYTTMNCNYFKHSNKLEQVLK